MLARSYLDSGMPLEALEQLQKLVEYQPLNSSNYELLAKGYLDAADLYLTNKKVNKAREMLIMCAEIYKLEHAEKTNLLVKYMDMASELLDGIDTAL